MRFVMALAIVGGVVLASGAAPAVAADYGNVVALYQQPSGQLDVDINVTESGGGTWWADPIWIGVGLVALILLVVIVALATRGGGTTIVRD